tara:strand:+ start:2015 stop:2179 length:165 start_codon:yes stop_codon:yes gene_type:complete
MNHLSVFLGIITGLILGGSFFGIALIFQVLTLITGLSMWGAVIYLLINQFKKGV